MVLCLLTLVLYHPRAKTHCYMPAHHDHFSFGITLIWCHSNLVWFNIGGSGCRQKSYSRLSVIFIMKKKCGGELFVGKEGVKSVMLHCSRGKKSPEHSNSEVILNLRVFFKKNSIQLCGSRSWPVRHKKVYYSFKRVSVNSVA